MNDDVRDWLLVAAAAGFIAWMLFRGDAKAQQPAIGGVRG